MKYLKVFSSQILQSVTYLFILSNICNICNYISEDVDASEENGFIEELIVVVKQDGSVVHWGEPNGWDANLCKTYDIKSI